MIGLVEYVLHDTNLQAENAVDEDIVGAELAARTGPAPWLMVQLGAGVAGVVGQRLDPDLALVSGTDRGIAPTFPTIQAHLLAEFRIPSVDVRVAPEVSVVSARSASPVEQTCSPSRRLRESGRTPWSLPASPRRRSTSGPRTPTSISMRVTDIFGTQGNEPGFNGIDYPTLGRRAWLNVTQAF